MSYAGRAKAHAFYGGDSFCVSLVRLAVLVWVNFLLHFSHSLPSFRYAEEGKRCFLNRQRGAYDSPFADCNSAQMVVGGRGGEDSPIAMVTTSHRKAVFAHTAKVYIYHCCFCNTSSVVSKEVGGGCGCGCCRCTQLPQKRVP